LRAWSGVEGSTTSRAVSIASNLGASRPNWTAWTMHVSQV